MSESSLPEAAPADDATLEEQLVGTRAEIHSLKGAAEHNGARGTTTEWDGAKHRYAIELDASLAGGAWQTLRVCPANLTWLPRNEPMPLLAGDEGWLSRPLEAALTALFGKFDGDGDGVLCEAELRAFSAAANEDGREFDADEIAEVHDYFQWKVPEDGVEGLTLTGWLDMYHTQTAGDGLETAKDLGRLGCGVFFAPDDLASDEEDADEGGEVAAPMVRVEAAADGTIRPVETRPDA